MSSDFFTNLQAVTSNIEDITFSRFATITSINGAYCNVKEDESELEHTQVPILNGLGLEVGDKVLLGFADNSIYNPFVSGVIGRNVNQAYEDKLDSMLEESLKAQGLPFFNINTNGHLVASYGFLQENMFSIDEEGHLQVTLPNNEDNPFHINNSGRLIYEG